MAKISNQISEIARKATLHKQEKKTRWSEALKTIQPYIPDYLLETLAKCP